MSSFVIFDAILRRSSVANQAEEREMKHTEKAWIGEQTEISFMHENLRCYLKKNQQLGIWCGYVGVDKDHPSFGKPSQELPDLDVHGGITFSGVFDFPNAADIWWIGFDCGHSVDIIPFIEEEMRDRMGTQQLEKLKLKRTYKDMRYVTEEVKKLAEQLHQVATDQEIVDGWAYMRGLEEIKPRKRRRKDKIEEENDVH